PGGDPRPVNDLAADDGGEVAVGVLDHAPPTAGQVVDHPGSVQAQGAVVDDIDIRLLAHRDASAIPEAHQVRRVGGEDLDGLGDADALPGAVPGPVGQQGGGVAGIGDQAVMGAAVAKADDTVGVADHAQGGVQVAVDVIGKGDEQERMAVVLQQQVVGHLDGADAPRPGHGGDALG